MAELWNIPGKDRPSFWTRQVRGLGLPGGLRARPGRHHCSPGWAASAAARSPPDQRALADLAKQEVRRPEQSVEVTFEQPYQARRQWQRRFLTS
jgi:hypothetical protein